MLTTSGIFARMGLIPLTRLYRARAHCRATPLATQTAQFFAHDFGDIAFI